MSKVLIVGLGFVGSPLAQALHAKGHAVTGLTHAVGPAERLSQPSSAEVRQADVAELGSLKQAVREPVDWIVHCASSGRGGPDKYRRVYRDGLANLRELCPQARVLYTSSTSVYAQLAGELVDEEAPAKPDRETGQILRETEELALASGGLVTRLAGIYGPGRSFILLKYLNGTAVIEGDGGRYLNQAHVVDIVSALSHLIEINAKGIYNIVDSTPQTQRAIFQSLADHFQGELPPKAPPDYERKRGWTHKRVSNAKLRATGWDPRYRSFQDAIAHDASLIPSIRDLIDHQD
ncbi:MAG: NAD-dependent epimerase/dehydratase family protein [Verrucomicrobiaceae bacterium]|nr:NAD-dependent epimerase/dehydratase family protein [Verrucomicrobiaceae bacterium]